MITNYILTVVIVLLLSIIIVFFAKTANNKVLQEQNKLQLRQILHQKELLRTSIEAQEKERKRIAHELHDEIGGKLNVVGVVLQNLENEKENGDKAEGVRKLIRNTNESVRRIAHELHPPMLEEFGLATALEELISPLHSQYKTYFIHHRIRRFTLKVELQLLRIIQEFVSNTIKHGKAEQLGIQLKSSDQKLFMVLSDNGVGYDQEKESGGMGVSGIISRLEVLGASYRWKTSLNKGVRLIAIVPV